MDASMDTDMELWDEAERSLRQLRWAPPERRRHSRQGNDGCTPGDAENCPVCSANARTRDEYREALFAEIARLREAHARR